MMIPTLRQLRYFAALAETLHFGRAAARCHVTQPALSMQIRELETTLGVPLVERTPSGVLLTAAGAEIAERGREILLSVQDLADLAQHYGQPLSGPLRLGVIPTIGPYLLPRILPRVHANYPELQLTLRERQTALLVEDLGAGALDLLILALPIDRGDFATMPLFDDPFALAVAADHSLAKRDVVRDEDLLREPVLLLEEGNCLRDQALEVCHTGGANELDDFRASSLATVVQMVASGYGCTILPQLAVPVEATERPGLAVVPFAPPPPMRTIGLVWRRSSPRRAEFATFGELIVRELKASPGEGSERDHAFVDQVL